MKPYSIAAMITGMPPMRPSLDTRASLRPVSFLVAHESRGVGFRVDEVERVDWGDLGIELSGSGPSSYIVSRRSER
jgi:hypothetical protein